MSTKLSATAIEELFSRIKELHVVVVGDVMLDQYWWGDVERVSPEAPVPVVALRNKETRLGGAANVALNCVAMGAKVTLATVTGNDEAGNSLITLSQEQGIDTQLVMQSDERKTTCKTRVISRNQQMLRLDDETTTELTTAEEHPFIDLVLRMLQREKPQLLIFEDYDKGVLKPNIIKHIIAHCKELGIVTVVDPKRDHFFDYKEVDIFKPNLKEVKEGLNIPFLKPDLATLNNVHTQLVSKLSHEISLITLSEHGVYYGSNEVSEIYPSHRRAIADVSGAGDTVIATAGIFYVLTRDISIAAQIANLAGGLVCEEVGVVPVNTALLQKEAISLLATE